MEQRSLVLSESFSGRITWAFFGALSIFAFASFLSYHLYQHLIIRSNQLLQTSMAWVRLSEDVEKLETALEKSLVIGDERSRDSFLALAERVRGEALALAREPSLHPDALAYEDVRTMLETMVERGLTILEAKGNGSATFGPESFRAFSTTGEYLRARIHLGVMDLLRREHLNYRLISTRLELIGKAALGLILGGLVLAGAVLITLSHRLTRPLAELAEAARKVSQGDFSQRVRVRAGDEVGRVAEAFNRMAQALGRMVADLQEKGALEVRLRERELENLIMQNRLQEARLEALQAQIDPHFFFNALNTGVHLANLEEAERTAAFLEKMGRIFRYRLRNPGRAVALEEELNHVQDYVALLHMRFGEEAFSYRTEVEASLLDVLLPPLTLQPLVENAYRHGLSDSSGGQIVIRGYRQKDEIVIEVADDGRGIPPETAARVLASAAENGVGGVRGLANVVARLRLWTGNEHPVEILPGPERGTIVRLHLPIRE